MTDIRLIRAFYFPLAKEAHTAGFFETGIRSDGLVYFRNPYIEIPNEFGTCPDYYPRKVFSFISSTVEGLINGHEDADSTSPNWVFEIEYANGKSRTLRYTNRINSLKRYIFYNNFLSSIYSDSGNTIVQDVFSSKITIEKVRGEVALGVVALPRLLSGRLDLILAGSEEASIKLTSTDGLSISLLPVGHNRATTLTIDNSGIIQDSGGVLYTKILKERGVKVLFDKDEDSLLSKSSDPMVNRARALGFLDDFLDETPFPSLPEEIRIMFLDPQYLITEKTCEYTFANREELQTFCRYYQSGGDVKWSRATDYEDLYCEAFDYYERGDYEKAASLYRECIQDNPIAIEARFELVNCFINLEQFTYALIELAILKDLITTDYFASKFYRTLGYLYCETEKYSLAYSCYMYSQTFGGATKDVADELIYIYRKAEEEIDQLLAWESDYKKVLMDNNVPIISLKD